MINQPQFNRKVKGWIRAACRTATEYRACITFSCDTAEQAKRAARMAGKLLPNHTRAAIERIYSADSRATSRLS
jgi:hypothetical protein